MTILKRSLAPITGSAWEEIDDQAKKVLKSYLTARKFVDVEGPKGWDFSAVSTGRVEIPSGQDAKAVQYGIRMVQPLIEVEKTFTLERKELDAIESGAEDPELEPLEQAVSEAALFEENAIFNGFQLGGIDGLLENVENKVKVGSIENGLLAAISEALTTLAGSSIEGPYSLVIFTDLWKKVLSSSSGYPIERRIGELIGGQIIRSSSLKGAAVVSERGGDFELTLGSDYSIGYVGHTDTTVSFKIFESFSFRILEPRAIVQLTI